MRGEARRGTGRVAHPRTREMVKRNDSDASLRWKRRRLDVESEIICTRISVEKG